MTIAAFEPFVSHYKGRAWGVREQSVQEIIWT